MVQFQKGAKVHLIGIKGVGMTALAQVLISRGCVVTGSDGPAKFFTDGVLYTLGIPVAQHFSAENLPVDADCVISSVAYYFEGKVLGNNPEVAAALKHNLPILTYPQAVGELAKEYQVIAVAGSHGKSTTTAMLGWILEKVGFEPNVIVGTKVNAWESNARTGKGPHLVIEADEYRDAFLNYQPSGAVITSIDYDHPDYFKSPEEYFEAYRKFVDNLVGSPAQLSGQKVGEGKWLVIYGDDPQTKKLAQYAAKKQLKVLTYGFAPENTMLRLEDYGVSSSPSRVSPGAEGVFQEFSITFYGKKISAKIPFPGKQYILNSGAAVAAAVMSGASAQEAAAALATFPGTARRLEVVAKTRDFTIIDDYAHHPTAITITLQGVRAMYPGRKIICVFQPHMYSRTQALLQEFAACFTPADVVGIMEIYPSARETSGPVSGKDLANEAAKHHQAVTYLPDMAAGKQFVQQHSGAGNVIMLMGAGNVNELAF